MSKLLRLAALSILATTASVVPLSGQGPSALTPAITNQRVCPPPTPGVRECTARRLTYYPPGMAVASGVIAPQAAPSGFGPADLQDAYKLTELSASSGTGRTIAIVDAQDAPTAESDLGVYRSTFGLPSCTTANGCFRKVNQSGASSPLPAPDSGWASEINLDLDMVSAVCPNCSILLVEANSANDADLGTAENTAAQFGAIAISNSFGGQEDSAVTTICEGFYKHPGIAITASAGDDGYGVEFPASCQYVTAVGGTSLDKSNNSRGWAETVWGSKGNQNGGTGSGCSAYITKPSWQTDSGCSKRTVGDVAAVADPNTGVAVYDQGQWGVYGGTSVAAPLVAGVYGLAATAGANDVPASYAYANPAALFDVTQGTNGSCGGSYLCTAEIGYDGPTGLGTPNGVAAFDPNDNFSISASPANLNLVQGTSGSSTVSTTVTSGNAQTVNLTISGLPSGATASFNPASITTGGSATLTVNAGTAAAGTSSLTITGTGASATHSTSVALTITSPLPIVALTPAALTWGYIVEGVTAPAKTVTLTNTGSATLNIGKVTTSGDFAQLIVAQSCSSTLAPGKSCVLKVTFTPTQVGVRNGTLTVTDNASDSPQTVTLAGTGAVQAALTPSGGTFPAWTVGTTSPPKVFTLTNKQNVALNTIVISTTGDFAVSATTCTASLAGKGKCTISVTITPTATGTRTGQLSVSDSAGNSPQTSNLTGTGVTPATLAPASAAYPARVVGTTSPAKTFTLTNSQTVDLDSIVISTTGDFAVSATTCTASLAAKSKCTISVTFTPDATGTRTGQLSVADSAVNSPQTSNLTGTGK